MEPEGNLPVCNSLSLVAILSQINTVHSRPSYFCKIHLIGLLSVLHGSQVGYSLQVFPPQPCTHISFPSHVPACDAISYSLVSSPEQAGVEYKSWSSSLYHYILLPITPFLLGPNIFLSTLFYNTTSLCSLLNVKDPHKTVGVHMSIVILLYIKWEHKRLWTKYIPWSYGSSSPLCLYKL